MIIDTHHHYWQYNPVEFDWIDDEMATIQRSFLPSDLQQTLSAADVQAVVSVQARQTLEETDWLLHLAAENTFMYGVVGWLPLASVEIADVLAQYVSNPWLKGVRHVVQGEPDPEFLLRDDFNGGISTLKDFNLVYDLLIFERQLPNTIRFVDRHPNQVFVLDHMAKPQIKAGVLQPWAKTIRELAKRSNVSCKLSGMVTEADYKTWTSEQLQPYFDVVLEAFGPQRLLFGSDWPVCLVATEYSAWLSLVKKQLATLSQYEQELIFSKNAIQTYQLKKTA